jgi:hypothetical protein
MKKFGNFDDEDQTNLYFVSMEAAKCDHFGTKI